MKYNFVKNQKVKNSKIYYIYYINILYKRNGVN